MLLELMFASPDLTYQIVRLSGKSPAVLFYSGKPAG